MHKNCTPLTQNDIKEIIRIYDNKELDFKGTAKKFKISYKRLHSILENNNIQLKHTRRDVILSGDDIIEIINDYTIKHMNIKQIANKFNTANERISKELKRNGIQIRKEKHINENNVIKDYTENMSLGNLCNKYSISDRRIKRIIKKYKLKRKKLPVGTSRMIINKEKVDRMIELFNKFKSINLVVNELNICRKVIKRTLKENGINIKQKGQNGFNLEKWEYLYGKDMARKMWEKATYSSGGQRGIAGLYLNKYWFRSLVELSYILYLEKNNIKWETAETTDYIIKYKDSCNIERRYHPDFFLIENKQLIEIKPKNLQKDLVVLEKAKAAQDFCKNNGLEYLLLDFKVDYLEINNELKIGNVNFAQGNLERFLKAFNKRFKL